MIRTGNKTLDRKIRWGTSVIAVVWAFLAVMGFTSDTVPGFSYGMLCVLIIFANLIMESYSWLLDDSYENHMKTLDTWKSYIDANMEQLHMFHKTSRVLRLVAERHPWVVQKAMAEVDEEQNGDVH